MDKRLRSSLQTVLVIAIPTWAFFVIDQTTRAQDQSVPALDKQSQNEERAKQERKTRLDEMGRLAQGTTVSRIDGARKTVARLVAEPVFRFDSQYHGAIDATLWFYGDKGRPAAVQSVICWRRPGFPKHGFCLVSLSDGLIEARWTGGRQWSSTRPGITLNPLAESPKPATTEAARTRQMKDAIRRFTATRIDKWPWGDVGGQCRVLSQPVYRYRDSDAGIQDGSIFVAVGEGTAPDFFLLIELRGPDLQHAIWNYGVHRTTTAELHLRLDGKEVWSVPQESNPGWNIYATYLHFLLKQDKPNAMLDAPKR